MIALLHLGNDLPLHPHHFSGRDLRSTYRCLRLAKLACPHPVLKLLPNVRVGNLAHAAIERRFVKRSPVLHGILLEQMVAGIGDGLPCHLLRCPGLVGRLGWILFLGEPLRVLAHLGYNPVGLMAVLPRQFTMLPLHLCRRLQLLLVSCAVRCDLSRRRTVDALLALVILHLLPAGTRRLQVLPRVAFDLRLAILAALQLVTELLQARCQLRAIDRRAVVLRSIQLMRLDGAGLPVLTLGDVEDHGMGVELRRGVAVDGAGGVVLEGRGGELASRLRRMHVADPRLGVMLNLAQSDTDALPVRFPHPLITSDKRGQRD